MTTIEKFPIKICYYESLMQLNHSDRGRLITAVLANMNGLYEEIPPMNQKTQALYEQIVADIDRELSRLEKRKRTSRENGKKGGRPKGGCMPADLPRDIPESYVLARRERAKEYASSHQMQVGQVLAEWWQWDRNDKTKRFLPDTPPNHKTAASHLHPASLTSLDPDEIWENALARGFRERME